VGNLRSPDVGPRRLSLHQQGPHTWLGLAQLVVMGTYALHAYVALDDQRHAHGPNVVMEHAYDFAYPSGGRDTCLEPEGEARQD
jgi:hypothetical protein